MKKLLRIEAILLLLINPLSANAHDIYTGVVGKDHQLCCGANDCFATTYVEKHGKFFFRLKQEDGAIELNIPEDMITWTPIVGDTVDGPPNKAHLCYRRTEYGDLDKPNFAKRILDNRWLIFCAFIPPGAI